MKKIVLLVIMLVFLFPTVIGFAQDGDTPCSVENIQASVDDLITDYEENRTADNSLSDSLDSLNGLQSAIEAIYEECETIHAEEAIALLENLREGGYVIYVRHAATDPNQVDTDLSACSTQRNLNQQGRDDAVVIGEAWDTLGLTYSRLMSTQYCRTVQTAELAWESPEILELDNLVVELPTLLSTPLENGENIIIVAHQGTIRDLTELGLDEGEILVFRPLSDNEYELVGRITVDEWAYLIEIDEIEE